MTGDILQFPEPEKPELCAQCPQCSSLEFYIIIDGKMELIGFECSECGWDGGDIDAVPFVEDDEEEGEE